MRLLLARKTPPSHLGRICITSAIRHRRRTVFSRKKQCRKQNPSRASKPSMVIDGTILFFRLLCIPVNSSVRSPRIPFSPFALFLFPDQIHNNRRCRHSRKAADRNPQTDVALISGLWCRADLEGPFHRAQVINARVKDNRMISGSQ